jgi:hypothetical protein
MKRRLLSIQVGDQLLRPVNRDLIAYCMQNSLIPLNCFVDLNALVTHGVPPFLIRRLDHLFY